MELHKRITIFFIVMSSSAALKAQKDLAGSEGGSITLPDPVVEYGFLSYEVYTIAMVDGMKFEILEEWFNDRLFWNNKTRLFEIKRLKTNDSGNYIIDSKKGRVFLTSYKLKVYESISTPAVNTSSVSAESCVLLCSVEKAEEMTLLWYKDEEILNQSSSALSLLLTVHKQDFSSSYRCVAANPAEKKTLPVNITTSCRQQNNTDNTSDSNTQSWLFLIPLVVFESAVAVSLILKK